MPRIIAAAGLLAILAAGGAAKPTAYRLPPAARVAPVADGTSPARPLPIRVGGRVQQSGDDMGYVRQWPGTYFETAFRGSAAMFRVGAGDVILHVLVDDRAVGTLVKPAAGLYRVDGLAPGRHRLRVEVASESQAGPTTFGGFFAAGATRAAPLAVRSRQIEFIGDSHTVGYADTSTKRDCTQDEVWATTDTQRAFGAILARRYDADYQVNAISGRGVVRNYGGFAADTMPEAYPYTLFDKKALADQPGWHPQLIVIALGTNDFTTPLHAGERWKTRDELHADYEATYLRLVRSLRRRDPHAFFVLWATDMADGEIEAEVAKVAAALRESGETRVAYVPVNGLSLAACHMHPSLNDEQRLANALGAAIDRTSNVW